MKEPRSIDGTFKWVSGRICLGSLVHCYLRSWKIECYKEVMDGSRKRLALVELADSKIMFVYYTCIYSFFHTRLVPAEFVSAGLVWSLV